MSDDFVDFFFNVIIGLHQEMKIQVAPVIGHISLRLEIESPGQQNLN